LIFGDCVVPCQRRPTPSTSSRASLPQAGDARDLLLPSYGTAPLPSQDTPTMLDSSFRDANRQLCSR
jgi:hypothetical protein